MSPAERDSYLSESSGSENLSDIWSDDGKEKEQELYYQDFPELLQIHKFPCCFKIDKI